MGRLGSCCHPRSNCKHANIPHQNICALSGLRTHCSKQPLCVLSKSVCNVQCHHVLTTHEHHMHGITKTHTSHAPLQASNTDTDGARDTNPVKNKPYLFAGQGMHSPPLEPLYPGLQVHAVESVLPSGETALAGHAVEVWPSYVVSFGLCVCMNVRTKHTCEDLPCHIRLLVMRIHSGPPLCVSVRSMHACVVCGHRSVHALFTHANRMIHVCAHK